MNLIELFICPKCRGKLNKKEAVYSCENCSAEYQERDNVPIFITGELETDDFNNFWNEGWKERRQEGDHLFQDVSSEKYKNIVKNNVNNAINLKQPISSALPIGDKIVLNVGCGLDEASGFTAMGADNYIGIDFSFYAAKYSFENIKKLDGKGVTAQANAELLPIESNSIDVVYTSGVLHHTPNTEKAIDEVFRVLKKKGKGVIGLYSTYSPTFVVARIVNTIKSILKRQKKSWYELTETAWNTDGASNPWTKTYSKSELKEIFDSGRCENLNIRSVGFLWGNVIPFLGKYISKTKIGKLTAGYLSHKLGSMWVITFEKK